jgi:hypothetical protein
MEIVFTTFLVATGVLVGITAVLTVVAGVVWLFNLPVE